MALIIIGGPQVHFAASRNVSVSAGVSVNSGLDQTTHTAKWLAALGD